MLDTTGILLSANAVRDNGSLGIFLVSEIDYQRLESRGRVLPNRVAKNGLEERIRIFTSVKWGIIGCKMLYYIINEV